MFKNRVRTAALAGAIAVATGVSGLAVPAYAQEGFAVVDGTAATAVAPANVTETELQELTDATADYLEGFQEGGSLQALVDTYIDLGADGYDPSEEEARNAFDGAKANASAQLATSVENVNKARASVGFAVDQDEQADADWEILVEALNAAATEFNPLIDAVNEAKTIEDAPFTELPNLASNLEREDDIVEAYRALQALQDTVDEQFETAGDWNIDETDGQFINRDHMLALETLKDAVDGQVETVEDAYDTAVASNREAQKTDVLVRQLFLERATAQRDSLRIVEGIFQSAARYVELTVNDVLTDDNGVLSTEYREVQGNLWTGLGDNLEWLQLADDATAEYFLAWGTDESNPEEGDDYAAEKLRLATETYGKIFENGATWREALNRVQLIDANLEAEKAQLEADREAAREAAEREQAIADALEELAKGSGSEEPGDIEEPGMSSGSSEKGGLIGLVAAIGGVVALIAAAFPFISNFMR